MTVHIKVRLTRTRVVSHSVEEYVSGLYRKYGMMRRMVDAMPVRGREETLVRRAREL